MIHGHFEGIYQFEELHYYVFFYDFLSLENIKRDRGDIVYILVWVTYTAFEFTLGRNMFLVI